MGESISFDRAVDYYDRTRALSPATEASMVEAVSAELRGRGRVLEIGVGTGRIALPLRAAGADVVGVDISLGMLERLAAKGSAPVVAGDATRLPFRDASFGAALAVHVLHLIPAWRDAAAELLRVVYPGGVLLVSQGAWNFVAFPDVIEEFTRAAGIPMRHLGLNDERELDEMLEAAGARPRDLARIPDSRQGTLREMVDALRAGLYSFTWGATDAARAEGADAAEAYARETYGGLDEPREMRTEMYWRAYDLATA